MADRPGHPVRLLRDGDQPRRLEPGTFEARAVAAIQDALDEGYQAVAWAVMDGGGGGARVRTLTGCRIVETRCRITRPHSEPTEEILPLFGIWELFAEGTEILDLGRPSADFVYWRALALQETEDGRLLVAQASDRRGMAATPLSSARRPDGRPFGSRATELLLQSQIEGVRDRVGKAADRIGEDPRRPGQDLVAITAGGLAMYLGEKAATDGGPAVLEWNVSEVRLSSGDVNVLAASQGGDSRSRRGRLHGAVLKALEEAAFGHGVHSPRGKRRLVSRDDEDARLPEIAGRVEPDFSDEVVERLNQETVDRLARDDLVSRAARAGLSPRERDVFELRHVQGLPFAQIAEKISVQETTARVFFHRATKKLEAVVL